jgi:hypothetical protein
MATLRANLRRGLIAGAVAGALAGLLGVLGGAQTIDTAEAAAHGAEGGHADGEAGHTHAEAGHTGSQATADAGEADPAVSRTQARMGLVGGTVLAGLALGALLGVATGPAARRLGGDAWARTWKLGGAAAFAVVVLPALVYPATPPGAGDPDTVGARTALYLSVVLLGLAIAVLAGALQRPLARAGLTSAARQAATGLVIVAAGAAVVLAMPDAGVGTGDLSAQMVWTFRLQSLATQLALWLGVTAVFGLLAARAEHGGLRARSMAAASAAAT